MRFLLLTCRFFHNPGVIMLRDVGGRPVTADPMLRPHQSIQSGAHTT